jgi:ribonuclease VapC
MVIDTSALLAIAFRERERDDFSRAILLAPHALMSAANWLEAAIIADRRLLLDGRKHFDGLLDDLGVEIVPLSPQQAALARVAYREYGLYSEHAALNYGDCFAYALAKHTGEPLLFKGNDFSKTDIRSALG